MNKKNKVRSLPVVSRDALDAAVAEVATLKLQYDAAKTNMELEMARVQERHQEPMRALGRQLEIKQAAVRACCRQHRKELFPEKKSIDFLLATVGFRTEPPSVEKSSRKDSWAAIAQRLEKSTWGARYVSRPAPEVDKKALLADREKLRPDQLGEAGLRFKQDEVFYVTPKSEVAARSVLEAA